MRTTVLLLAIATGVLAGCTNDAARDRADTTESIADSAPAATAAGVAVMLSDENVLALLDTAYAAAAELDRLAARTAQDTALRGFASRAADANTLSRRAVAQTVERLKIVPTLPDREAIEDHGQTMTTLRGQRGAEFDRGYADAADKMREEMIDEIDDSMQGAERREDVRTLLQQLKATLESQRRDLATLKDRQQGS